MFIFSEAYSIACLGVTTCDWETLGFAALEQLSLDVARKAFQRSENIMYLHIIDLVQDILKSGDRGSESLAMAEIFAHRGRYLEAAKLFHSTGNDNKALNMYTDLKMFHKAQVKIYIFKKISKYMD